MPTTAALRYYPALLEPAPGGGFGVVFPDLPGCVSHGGDAQSASVNAAEALALHVEGTLEDGDPLPAPSAPGAPLPEALAEAAPGLAGAAWIMVPVEVPEAAPGVPRRVIEVALDGETLARLDAAAVAEGASRAEYVAVAVRERLLAASSSGPVEPPPPAA